MPTKRSMSFLRLALLGDGVASEATGLAMIAGAGLLEGVLGLPESLPRYAGLFLVPYAIVVAFVGTRERIARGAVLAIVAVNLLWVVESLALLVGGWVAPTALGTAFVLFQAAVVGALRRRSGSACAATRPFRRPEPFRKTDMTTFAIAHLHAVRMGPAIAEYLERIDATLAPFGGRFVLHGEPIEPLEGSFEGDLVIIAFPDRASARAWYRSPAYQAILPLRRENAEGAVFLVDTVGSDHRATDILR